MLPFERDGPCLHATKNFAFDVAVQRGCLEYRYKVVHEFSGGHLNKEVVSTVLDAYISQLNGIIVSERFRESWTVRTVNASNSTLGFL